MRTTLALTACITIAAGWLAGRGAAGPAGEPASQPRPGAFWIEKVDGTVLTGRLALRTLHIRTTPKPTAVPVERLVSIRVGLDARPALGKRIGALIRQLGADEYRRRQAAQDQLTAMGPALEPILRPYLNDSDAERVSRVEHILKAYEAWESTHPNAPRSAVQPLRRQTEVRTSSAVLTGPVVDPTIRILVAGRAVDVPVGEIHRLLKVGSKPDLDACLVHGRVEGRRTDFVKDVPEVLAARYRRVTKTASATGPVTARYKAAPWLYPVKGKNETPRIFVANGKKHYPIRGTWRLRWANGWLYQDENGRRIKGPAKAAHPHHETKVDYYVVPLKPAK